QRVATEILALRHGDPGVGDDGYAASVAPQHHRVDPDNPGQGYYAPFYGARSHCFAVTRRHHLDEPPRPGDAAYRRALREVRVKGIAPNLIGTVPKRLPPVRTPEETAVGLFWAYDGAKGLGTPPRLYNQMVRVVAQAQGNDTARNARLFALVNAAMADAGILCWADKYTYDLWRPVLGIREHDSALGPAGEPGGELDQDTDIGWLPLGAPSSNSVGQKNKTPNFPSYPSGHATFGAAAFQTVRRFYGQTGCGSDHLADGLTFVSDELNGVTVDNAGTVRPRLVRRFPGGLWQMIEEVGRSRVYLGVHWVFDAFAVDHEGRVDLDQNVGGVRLGLDIADDLAANGLHANRAAGPA
ncbi:vanadium-dependent haloperoxidase, partial [Micromonospora zhanjiangensis]